MNIIAGQKDPSIAAKKFISVKTYVSEGMKKHSQKCSVPVKILHF